MRTAIMISGRGSNLQALLDLASSLRVSLVVSSTSSALGLFRARRMGLQTLILDAKIDYKKLNSELENRGVQKIFLAGFMKIIPASFVKQWEGRMINIHPSLLPLYPGLSAFEKSFAEKNHLGVTLHQVTAELDAGPKLRQVRFFEQSKWTGVNLGLSEAQQRLSFTEQRLVREVQHLWK